jgi:hypothetical protein
MFIIENRGVRAEGSYHKLAKAKREALKLSRRERGEVEAGHVWQQLRDGSVSLCIDDGFDSYQVGIVVREDN